MRRAKKLTLSALLSALGVVILSVGSLLEVLDLSTVFVASLLVVFLQIELGTPWQWLTWGATALLALVLLPNKFCAYGYLIGGMYPICKYYLEKLPRVPATIAKCALFNVLAALLLWVSLWLFGLPEMRLGLYLPLMALLANAVFVCYDLVLTRAALLYCRKYRHRIQKLLK
ncbi:MAG: hypothetical protein WDA00_02835 [Eubacteriales bacterium]